MFFASRWRRVAETSPVEFIENRFGNYMRQGIVWLGIPSRIFDDALKIFAIGTVVSIGLGFPLKTAIVVCALIMTSYTFFGGLWAALVADCIQFIVMLAGVIALPVLVLKKTGGVNAFLDNAPEGFFALTTQKYPWSYIIAFFIVIALQYNTAWSLVQRYYSSDSDRNARRVGYMVTLLNIISPLIFFFPAMAARTFLPNIENANSIYPTICRTVLPVGMLGLFIAAMFSATMSAVAGDFNVIASVLTKDFFKRMIKPNATAQTEMIVARINTIVVAIITVALTFLVDTVQGSGDLFQVLVKILALFMPPIAMPMLLGLLTRRISNGGALLGLWGGVVTGAILFALSAVLPSFPKEQTITLLICLATIIWIVIGTVLWPGSELESEKTRQFMQKVAVESENIAPVGHSFSPATVIGVGILSIGLILFLSVILIAKEKPLLSIGVGLAMTFAGILLTIYSQRKMFNKQTQ
jgi:SSS family transporter